METMINPIMQWADTIGPMDWIAALVITLMVIFGLGFATGMITQPCQPNDKDYPDTIG